MVDVESLALSLHEACRAAVEGGATVAAEKFGEQAGWLLDRYRITKNLPEVPERAA